MHAPSRAAERKRRSTRGVKTTAEHRTRRDEDAARAAVSKVEAGELEPDVARAMFTGWRTVAVLVELQRKLKETEDLEQRVEALEHRRRRAKPEGSNRWG